MAEKDFLAKKTDLDTKQDTLIAGPGIHIADDGKTISATGGGGGTSSIIITPQITTGTRIATFNVDGDITSIFAPAQDQISFEDVLWSGTATPTTTDYVANLSGNVSDYSMIAILYSIDNQTKTTVELVSNLIIGNTYFSWEYTSDTSITFLANPDITPPLSVSSSTKSLTFVTDSTEITYLSIKGLRLHANTDHGITNFIGTVVPSSTLGDEGSIYMQYDGTTKEILKVYGEIEGEWREFPLPDIFEGTDGTNPGVKGLVPAPTINDENKYLRGDGTWSTVDNELSNLNDVTFVDLTDGEGLKYDSEEQKWINAKFFKTLYGTTDPSSSRGSNGDIYMKYNNNEILTVYGKINGTWLEFPKTIDPAAIITDDGDYLIFVDE